jgi:very-short-patch-repair endonuclease
VRGKETAKRARELRRRSTDAEAQLWWLLRDRRLLGFKFRRQHRIGPYFADFACAERKLVIELDGGQHVERRKDDDRRTASLAMGSWRVMRFWDDDVLLRTADVLEMIVRTLTAPHPSPFPARGEREPRYGSGD